MGHRRLRVFVDDPAAVPTVADALRTVVVAASPADENGFVVKVGSSGHLSILLDRSGFVLARRRNFDDLVSDLAAVVESLVRARPGWHALAVRAIVRKGGLVVAPMLHIPTIVDAQRTLNRHRAELLPTLRTLVDEHGRDESGRAVERFVYLDDPLRPPPSKAERAAMLARMFVTTGPRRDVLDLSVELADRVEFRHRGPSSVHDMVQALAGD